MWYAPESTDDESLPSVPHTPPAKIVRKRKRGELHNLLHTSLVGWDESDRPEGPRRRVRIDYNETDADIRTPIGRDFQVVLPTECMDFPSCEVTISFSQSLKLVERLQSTLKPHVSLDNISRAELDAVAARLRRHEYASSTTFVDDVRGVVARHVRRGGHDAPSELAQVCEGLLRECTSDVLAYPSAVDLNAIVDGPRPASPVLCEETTGEWAVAAGEYDRVFADNGIRPDDVVMMNVTHDSVNLDVDTLVVEGVVNQTTWGQAKSDPSDDGDWDDGDRGPYPSIQRRAVLVHRGDLYDGGVRIGRAAVCLRLGERGQPEHFVSPGYLRSVAGMWRVYTPF